MKELYIMGLGPGDIGQLPLANYQLLKNASKIYLRTEQHPLVADLRQEGIKFQTFDYLYDQAEDFSAVYAGIVDYLLEQTPEGQVIYAVPGHPMVAEESVNLLLARAKEMEIPAKVLPAMSFLDGMFNALGFDPIAGLKVLDALIEEMEPDPSVANIFTQVYSPLIASDLKLKLMEVYPDDTMITVLKAVGVPQAERIEQIPLYELDRLNWVDYLTSVYIPANPEVIPRPMERLEEIMAELRGENGCPWDKEQTHESLKTYLLEETYEVLDALNEGNMYKICEELGDLLLQIVFHAQIAKENAYFEMNDVIIGIIDKLIRRHPHIFGEVKVNNSTDVTINWEAIKKQEKQAQGIEDESVLAGIPKSMSPLLKAYQLQRKAAKVGFDWEDYSGALSKVQEEIQEVEVALAQGDNSAAGAELGDLLFAVVNLARHLKTDSEAVLANTNQKFQQRFQYIENKLRTEKRSWQEVDLQYLDKIWEEYKEKVEKKAKNS